VVLLALRPQAWLESARAEVGILNLYAERDRGAIPGIISLNYNAFYNVTAGIDLNSLSENNIRIDGTTVIITVPGPQVRECILNLDKSFYANRNCSRGPGLGDWPGCRGLEENLLNQAQAGIVAYDHSELLAEAYQSAADTLENLAMTVGGVQTVIIEPGPAPENVYSQAGTCVLLLPPPAPTATPVP
jgi:hypothetical protein